MSGPPRPNLSNLASASSGASGSKATSAVQGAPSGSGSVVSPSVASQFKILDQLAAKRREEPVVDPNWPKDEATCKQRGMIWRTSKNGIQSCVPRGNVQKATTQSLGLDRLGNFHQDKYILGAAKDEVKAKGVTKGDGVIRHRDSDGKWIPLAKGERLCGTGDRRPERAKFDSKTYPMMYTIFRTTEQYPYVLKNPNGSKTKRDNRLYDLDDIAAAFNRGEKVYHLRGLVSSDRSIDVGNLLDVSKAKQIGGQTVYPLRENTNGVFPIKAQLSAFSQPDPANPKMFDYTIIPKQTALLRYHHGGCDAEGFSASYREDKKNPGTYKGVCALLPFKKTALTTVDDGCRSYTLYFPGPHGDYDAIQIKSIIDWNQGLFTKGAMYAVNVSAQDEEYVHPVQVNKCSSVTQAAHKVVAAYHKKPKGTMVNPKNGQKTTFAKDVPSNVNIAFTEFSSQKVEIDAGPRMFWFDTAADEPKSVVDVAKVDRLSFGVRRAADEDCDVYHGLMTNPDKPSLFVESGNLNIVEQMAARSGLAVKYVAYMSADIDAHEALDLKRLDVYRAVLFAQFANHPETSTKAKDIIAKEANMIVKAAEVARALKNRHNLQSPAPTPLTNGFVSLRVDPKDVAQVKAELKHELKDMKSARAKVIKYLFAYVPISEPVKHQTAMQFTGVDVFGVMNVRYVPASNKNGVSKPASLIRARQIVIGRPGCLLTDDDAGLVVLSSDDVLACEKAKKPGSKITRRSMKWVVTPYMSDKERAEKEAAADRSLGKALKTGGVNAVGQVRPVFWGAPGFPNQEITVNGVTARAAARGLPYVDSMGRKVAFNGRDLTIEQRAQISEKTFGNLSAAEAAQSQRALNARAKAAAERRSQP